MDNTKQTVLILSGGSSPDSNNYSQYLQALRLDGFFDADPNSELTTLFGSGITPESQATASPDVKKEDSDGNIDYVTGPLSGNQAATKENVDYYFQTALGQKKWQHGDSFVLIVADHGLPNDIEFSCKSLEKDDDTYSFNQNYSDNLIDLWHPDATLYPENNFLSVSALKESIASYIPEYVPVTVIMTQCYSGGFHYLGYELGEDGFPVKDSNRDIAVFTAISKDTTASGCTPNVKEDTYDGYERRITEELTGQKVLSGDSIKPPVRNVLEAHNNTLLTDNTKDTPLRTSENYMLDLIEAMDQTANSDIKTTLHGIWLTFDDSDEKEKMLSKLSPVLRQDLERRLELIDQLALRIQEWYPSYSELFKDFDLNKIGALASTLESKSITSDEKIKKYTTDFNNDMRPLIDKYHAYLEKNQHLEEFEFETYVFSNAYDDTLIRRRLSQEDPSLQKYERYLHYRNNRSQIIIDWAKSNLTSSSDLELIAEAQESKITKVVSSTQKSSLEEQNSTLAGLARRLEYQMLVATGVIHLSNTKELKDKLKDFESFVEDERRAKI